MRLGVVALCRKPIREPHLRLGAAEERGRDGLAARRRNRVIHGRCRNKRPLPVVFPQTRAEVSSLAMTGLCARSRRSRPPARRTAFRRAPACWRWRPRRVPSRTGRRAPRRASVADHLAGVQIGHEGDDTGTERRAGHHVGGRFRGDARLAAWAMALVQVDPRGDGLDRRQIDVVVGEHVRLIGRQSLAPQAHVSA